MSRVTWGTQVLIEMTNWCIICLILRRLIRTNSYFLLHLSEHMQKYSGYADSQFASSCIAPSWSLNLRWLLLPSQFFSLFFFPSAASKASVIKAVWAREREGGRGRERKNVWNSQTNRRMRKQGCLHKQKQRTTNSLILFSLQNKISVRQTRHLNWRNLSVIFFFSFRPPSSSA